MSAIENLRAALADAEERWEDADDSDDIDIPAGPVRALLAEVDAGHWIDARRLAALATDEGRAALVVYHNARGMHWWDAGDGSSSESAADALDAAEAEAGAQ